MVQRCLEISPAPTTHLDLGMYKVMYSSGGRSTRAPSPSQGELWGRIGAAGGREDIVAESDSSKNHVEPFSNKQIVPDPIFCPDICPKKNIGTEYM